MDIKTYTKPKTRIEALKNFFGPKSKCTGIKINGESSSFLNQPQKEMKLCEAVSYSFRVPIKLTAEMIGCPGARRSLGLEKESGELINTISKNSGIPGNYIRQAFKEIPVIDTKIDHLILGINKEMEEELIPDVYIIYTKPGKVMNLIQQLAKKEIKIEMPPYSIHSICGNVFARAYQKKEIAISFGCPDSRKFGGVKEEEVIVGIPYEKADLILEDYLDI